MSVYLRALQYVNIKTQLNADLEWKAKKYDQKCPKIATYPTPVHTITKCVGFVQDSGNTSRAVRAKEYL